MVGALDVPFPRDTRLLKLKDDAHSGLVLARVRGSPDPRVMEASRSSRVGGGDKDHAESLTTVLRSSGLGMAGALDVSSPCDAQLPEIPDPKNKGRRPNAR
eukprot:6177029-Pleurochrysis_carterae.AAC.2